MIFIAAITSFIIGSIPFAVIFTRLAGVDVRRVGSGNPGFSNAVRAVGVIKALPVLLTDIGKGWCGAYIALMLGGGWWAAILVVAGHCFSPWLGFKGGKGVATFIGIAWMASPIIAIISILVWFVVFVPFRIASLSSLSSILIILIGIWLSSPETLSMFVVAFAIIVIRFSKNITYLLKGIEPKLVF